MASNMFSPMAKIGGQYVSSQNIVMEAKDNGFTEGIALDINGQVSEGSGENIFVIYKGVIYTPPLGSSILGGITRDAAITIAKDLGYDLREQAMTREMLYLADEIFFTAWHDKEVRSEGVPLLTLDSSSLTPRNLPEPAVFQQV